MEITSVKIRKIEKEGSRMKGFASVVVDDEVAIHYISIIEVDNGLVIAMPSHKNPMREYRDYVHPINQEVRTMFEKEILDAYENAEEVQTAKEEE